MFFVQSDENKLYCSIKSRPHLFHVISILSISLSPVQRQTTMLANIVLGKNTKSRQITITMEIQIQRSYKLFLCPYCFCLHSLLAKYTLPTIKSAQVLVWRKPRHCVIMSLRLYNVCVAVVILHFVGLCLPWHCRWHSLEDGSEKLSATWEPWSGNLLVVDILGQRYILNSL